MTQPVHDKETERLTPDQIMAEVNNLLTQNGYTIGLVAIGHRTGAACPIEDFMPDSHYAAMRIVEKSE